MATLLTDQPNNGNFMAKVTA